MFIVVIGVARGEGHLVAMVVGLSDQERFIVELEFVQSLANPAYFSCNIFIYYSHLIRPLVLAQNGSFNDPKFMAYLKYLRYWHQPTYAKHIQYQYYIKITVLTIMYLDIRTRCFSWRGYWMTNSGVN